jgi:hypothetical protein
MAMASSHRSVHVVVTTEPPLCCQFAIRIYMVEWKAWWWRDGSSQGLSHGKNLSGPGPRRRRRAHPGPLSLPWPICARPLAAVEKASWPCTHSDCACAPPRHGRHLCAAATAAATGLGSRATGRDGTAGRYGSPKKILVLICSARDQRVGRKMYCMRTPPTRYCRLGGWPWPRPTGHFPQLWRCLRAPAGRSPDRFTPGFGRARARGRSGSGGRWRWWTDRRRTNDRSCCC